MKIVQIRLPSVKQVQQFVGTLTSLAGDFELISGQYVLDARSLMGIFGFDLSKPLNLKIYNDNPENLAAIKPYMIQAEDTKDEQ